MKLIDKSALVAEIERLRKNQRLDDRHGQGVLDGLHAIERFIDTLEVIDPYEQCIQYASIESGIKAHAEDYSFNIESELFNQLTKEQQALWRKEIEQACISGGYSGLNLAKDPRYKENLEVKEVDLKKEVSKYISLNVCPPTEDVYKIAKHFFKLGLRSTITEEDCKLIWNIGDEIPNMPEEEFFKELLRRYKAQKGE